MENDNEMWELPYYHGLLPREDVNELLVRDGDFLIRKSEETSGQERIYVISVVVKGEKHHAIFHAEGGLVALDFKHERGFKTIRKFVETHQKKGDSIIKERKVVLLKGISKQKWELSHSSITQGAELGRGAFGVVRRGTFRCSSSPQPLHVAIKEVSQTSTKAQIKEFMNEARIMRQFDHKNVITFHGVAVGQEPLMVVMELATHGALTDYLRSTNRSPRSKLFMCYGAAAGLDHVHSKGVMHCDIAARNCLYSQNTVKIADFGLAHKGAQKPLDTGKPVPIRWLPPETLRDRMFTPKSDTWAFGVMCWEIFNNVKQPYDFASNADVITMVVRGRRLRFPTVVPVLFADFIRSNVWDADASTRYSMKDVLSWIEVHIEELRVSSSASSRSVARGSRASQRSSHSNEE